MSKSKRSVAAGYGALSVRSLVVSVALHGVLLGGVGVLAWVGAPQKVVHRMTLRVPPVLASAYPIYAPEMPDQVEVPGLPPEPELQTTPEAWTDPFDDPVFDTVADAESPWQRPQRLSPPERPHNPTEESVDPQAAVAESESTPSQPAPPPPTAAVWLEGPDPEYPRLSIRSGEEGSVVCVLTIEPDGRVSAVYVLVSSGFPRLDRAAREALLQWRFRAASSEGQPVQSSLEHTVTFELQG